MKGTNLSSTRPSLYIPAGIFILRSPTLPFETFQAFAKQVSSAPYTDTGEQPAHATWHDLMMRQGHEQAINLITSSPLAPLLQTAISCASEDLPLALQKRALAHQEQAKLCSSLLRYILRMSTRTTPFGLFAGVALGQFATDHTSVQLQAPPVRQFVLRPDMDWFFSWIAQLEKEEDFRARLQWQCNQTARMYGNRVVLSTDIYGQNTPGSATMRAVPILRHLLEYVREPMTPDQITENLLEAFPSVPKEQLLVFLRRLWEARFFFSTLHPSLLTLTPVQDTLKAFPDADGWSDQKERLQSILEQMSSIQNRGLSALIHELPAVVAQQKQLVSSPQTFQLDYALHTHGCTMHESIAHAAAYAAELCMMLSPYPKGKPSMARYREAFLEKYGPGEEVLLLDLIRPDEGLGFPLPYTLPASDPALLALKTSSAQQEYNHTVAHLYAQTLATREQVLELNDADIADLTRWSPTQNHHSLPPLSLDVFAQVEATSANEIAQGKWTRLIVHGLSLGGNSFNRFAPLWDERERETLRACARREESLLQECLFVDLACLPSPARLANVVIRQPAHRYELPLHTTSSRGPEHTIQLNDIVVGVRGGRFYCRSLRLQKELKFVHRNMLVETRLPHIGRLLLDLSCDGWATPGGFDWGALRHAPFLPRVAVGNIVLSLARWRLQRNLLEAPEKLATEYDWFVAFQQWRATWRVPRFVYWSQVDQRMVLDLEHPVMVRELTGLLQKQSQGEQESIIIQEMLPDCDHHWLEDDQLQHYVAELTIPVWLNAQYPQMAGRLARHSQQAEQISQAASKRRLIPLAQRRQLPSSTWTSVHLAADPAVHDEIIAEHIRPYIVSVQEQHIGDMWFYLRYPRPDHHLRIRAHAPDQARNELLISMATWAGQLVRSGIISDFRIVSYDREIQRYGGPEAIPIIEQVFCANSVAMSAILAAQKAGQVSLNRDCIAVLCLEHFFTACGYDLDGRLRYLQARVPRYAHVETFRLQRSRLTDLCLPWQFSRDPDTLQQRSVILSQLESSTPCLDGAMRDLAALERQNLLGVCKDELMASLAHMLVNRLCSVDREREQRIYAWWYHTLLAIKQRPSRVPSPYCVTTM